MILLALLVVIALAGALMFVGEKLGGAVGEKLRAASIFCFLVGIPLVLLIFRGDSGGGLDSELLWRGPR